MATVLHPAFPSDSRSIPDADLSSWLEQGWLEVKASEIAAEARPVGTINVDQLDPAVAVTFAKPRDKK